MLKNIAIVFLIIVAGVEGYFLTVKKEVKTDVEGIGTAVRSTSMQASPSATATGRPQLLIKGMKLKDNPVSKNAYQIFPGELSAETQKALVGWNITTKKLTDGSTQVSLTPKDSDDISQQYTIKPGNILYFVEITMADDSKDDRDLNLRDDYGIIVDKDGIVQ